jgi:hypothetical protein
VVAFVTPVTGGTTTGQSGIAIQLVYSDDASGIESSSLQVTSNRKAGGVFRRNGTTMTVPVGIDLGSQFAGATAGSATWVVPDSLALEAGSTTLSARIADQAGNVGTATVTFTVIADPDAVILSDLRANAGTTGVPWLVGTRNSQPLGGLQFEVSLNPAVIASVDSMRVTDRAANLTGSGFRVTNNVLRVIAFDAQGSSMGSGESAILRVFVTLRAGAPAGSHGIAATGVWFAAEDGASRAGLGTTAAIIIP